MKVHLQKYLTKLEDSKEYAGFMKKHPKAFLFSALFVRDLVDKKNQTDLAYYDPTEKQIYTFSVERGVTLSPMPQKPMTVQQKAFIPQPLKLPVNLAIDQLHAISVDEMHNRGITDTIQKMLLSLQFYDNRMFWNCTCFLSGMGILQVHIDDTEESVLFMEKKSFFDFVVPVKKGESVAEALSRKNQVDSQKSIDPEKTEGNHVGFIG